MISIENHVWLLEDNLLRINSMPKHFTLLLSQKCNNSQATQGVPLQWFRAGIGQRCNAVIFTWDLGENWGPQSPRVSQSQRMGSQLSSYYGLSRWVLKVNKRSPAPTEVRVKGDGWGGGTGQCPENPQTGQGISPSMVATCISSMVADCISWVTYTPVVLYEHYACWW